MHRMGRIALGIASGAYEGGNIVCAILGKGLAMPTGYCLIDSRFDAYSASPSLM